MSSTTNGPTPVIVGVGQVIQRPGDVDLEDARGPIELMADAARAAAADAGAPQLLDRVDFVGVAGGWFRYHDPGRQVGELIGSPHAATALTAISGTAPQDLVALAGERIAAGDLDVALVLGGEARWSRKRLERDGHEPGWILDDGHGNPESLGGFPDEMMLEARVFGGATASYALFEDRLRFSAGQSVEQHRDHLADLWAGFSAVASTNPHAWDQTVRTAREVREPRPDNRMIAFPYTKAMVANNTVDMASAILVCSTDAARAAGIATDRLVFPQVITRSHETWLVAARDQLDHSPALAAAGHAAFAHVGLGPDDIDHVDLYACFPSIVQMSSGALGLGTDRELTVTGGLGFAGAPVGNAVGHSIAAMVARVRDGGIGLVHGNGGQATKHSFGIYRAAPPDRFVALDVQETVDLAARRALPEDWSGAVTVEAATLVYGREGPSHVLAGVLDAAGARGWATSDDPAWFDILERDGLTGLTGVRTSTGALEL